MTAFANVSNVFTSALDTVTGAFETVQETVVNVLESDQFQAIKKDVHAITLATASITNTVACIVTSVLVPLVLLAMLISIALLVAAPVAGAGFVGGALFMADILFYTTLIRFGSFLLCTLLNPDSIA